MTCLRPAELEIESELRHVVSKPVVSPKHLNWEKYILENQTIELLEPDLEQNKNEDDQFGLGEYVVKNKENCVPSFTKEGKDNRNLIKINADEVIKAELKSEESAPLIQKIKNGTNDKASAQEKASMQLAPIRHEVSTELYIDAIGPLPFAPTRDKYILPDMCMSPKYHETVPMPETAYTPFVEALLQIFRRRVFPKEIQTDEGTLFMSILVTYFFEKLGTYCPLQMPFTFKNAFYYFRRVRPELLRGYKKFDLLCLDIVVIFSENWNYIL
ncbi:uncharacterized protein TNIN_408201 [Trichonephila inaurata madagascariensis]|uniref:Integrase catalytic domain-containing protein n=1 Tax=Trichonephila inaurata madagascariensis TaxID=2747483 RepID=A0A8X6Y7J2_9ARAC|nr:uncharacterized protein TNIN_408201 [Trichonephila inaurata madagascariensis]